MDILAKVEANKATCSTGSQTRNNAIDVELFSVKTRQHHISLTLWFGRFFICNTAIMQFIRILNRCIAISLCWLSLVYYMCWWKSIRYMHGSVGNVVKF